MKKPPKKNQKGMFFDCFVFRPEKDMTEDELMNITVEIFRRWLVDPETKEPRYIPEDDPPAKRLLRLLLSLGIMIETDVFENFPEDVKRHFYYLDREGTSIPYKLAKKRNDK